MKDFYLNKCSIADLELLQKLSIETFASTYQHLNTKENFEKYINASFNKLQLSKELEDSNIEFYFLQKENKTIGYLKLNEGIAQTEKMPTHCYEVERIYLLKTHQGKGYGRALIEKAIEVASSKNKKELWLGVWEKNQGAIEFYKKMGFFEFDTHIFKLGDEEQLDYLLKIKI